MLVFCNASGRHASDERNAGRRLLSDLVHGQVSVMRLRGVASDERSACRLVGRASVAKARRPRAVLETLKAALKDLRATKKSGLRAGKNKGEKI